jgi:hypothetical protein
MFNSVVTLIAPILIITYALNCDWLLVGMWCLTFLANLKGVEEYFNLYPEMKMSNG